MTEEEVGLRGEDLDFTEEQRPTSAFTSSLKRRLIIITVVVTNIVIAVIIVTVVAVVVTQLGKEDPNSESKQSDHWCGLTLPTEVNMSEVKGPVLISGSKTCDITGTCWKKEQCYTCLEGPNSDLVGNINNIPVCCPQCGRYGLSISWNKCDCRN